MNLLEQVIHQNVTILGNSIECNEMAISIITTAAEHNMYKHILVLQQLIEKNIECFVELKPLYNPFNQ